MRVVVAISSLSLALAMAVPIVGAPAQTHVDGVTCDNAWQTFVENTEMNGAAVDLSAVSFDGSVEEARWLATTPDFIGAYLLIHSLQDMPDRITNDIARNYLVMNTIIDCYTPDRAIPVSDIEDVVAEFNMVAPIETRAMLAELAEERL